MPAGPSVALAGILPDAPCIHARLHRLATKPGEKCGLIEQAGPKTQEYMERIAAAYQLEYSVSSPKNLKDLYWLAIQEVWDAWCEFRTAICYAIYRTEKARRQE
jgi:hypothetical protein